jgi:hypothetical protein
MSRSYTSFHPCASIGVLWDCYSSIRLEGQIITTKTSMRIAGRWGRDLNPGPSEHEAGVLNTQPRLSVWQVNDDEWTRTNIHALGEIRTHNLSVQAFNAYASDCAASGTAHSFWSLSSVLRECSGGTFQKQRSFATCWSATLQREQYKLTCPQLQHS